LKQTGYLAEIESKEEHDLLTEMLNLDTKKHLFPYWIGFHYKDGGFKYRNNTGNHTSWCQGMPQQTDKRRCVFLKV
jgi:hypothetical protein